MSYEVVDQLIAFPIFKTSVCPASLFKVICSINFLAHQGCIELLFAIPSLLSEKITVLLTGTLSYRLYRLLPAVAFSILLLLLFCSEIKH